MKEREYELQEEIEEGIPYPDDEEDFDEELDEDSDDDFLPDEDDFGDEDLEDYEEYEELPGRGIKIKYNHEEMEIPYEEAIPLVQKGMNYDKLYEKLQEYEQHPILQMFEKEAEELGMTTDEYLEVLLAEQEAEEIEELTENNIPYDVAKEIVEARNLKELLVLENEQKQLQELEQQEFSEFINMFPDVEPEDILPETWLLFEQGVPLKYAYMEQERNQLLTEIEKVEQNTKNKSKSPVRGVSSHGYREEADDDDPFLKGFNSI